jgi:hypothetical protein
MPAPVPDPAVKDDQPFGYALASDNERAPADPEYYDPEDRT